MAKKIIFLFITIAQIVNANTATSYIRIELRTEKQIEQQAIVLEGSELTFTRNTNFLCPDSTTGEIGLFKSTVKDHSELGQLLSKLSDSTISEQANQTSWPAYKFYVNKNSVTGDPILRNFVQKSISGECDLKKWVSKDTIRYQVVGLGDTIQIKVKRTGNENYEKQIDLKTAGCKRVGNYIECTQKEFGHLRLKVKK
jgi:hypothetical protein